VDLFGGARFALGVTDDPAHGIAGGDRTGACELLTGLERNVGDLARRGIDLIERATGEWIDLYRVDKAVAHRLDAGGGIGLIDARRGVRRLRRGFTARQRLQLPGQRQRFWQFHDLDLRRRIGEQHGGLCGIVERNLRRLLQVRAAASMDEDINRSANADLPKDVWLSWRETGTMVPRKYNVIVPTPSTS